MVNVNMPNSEQMPSMEHNKNELLNVVEVFETAKKNAYLHPGQGTQDEILYCYNHNIPLEQYMEALRIAVGSREEIRSILEQQKKQWHAHFSNCKIRELPKFFGLGGRWSILFLPEESPAGLPRMDFAIRKCSETGTMYGVTSRPAAYGLLLPEELMEAGSFKVPMARVWGNFFEDERAHIIAEMDKAFDRLIALLCDQSND